MRKILLNNLGLKIFSLALAVLLWLVVRMYLERQARPAATSLSAPAKYHCPVQVLHSSTNAQVYQVLPNEVTVTVSGDPVVLRRLKPDDIQVFIRLLDLAEPHGVFLPEVVLPPNVRFVEVEPPQVTVSLQAPK